MYTYIHCILQKGCLEEAGPKGLGGWPINGARAAEQTCIVNRTGGGSGHARRLHKSS